MVEKRVLSFLLTNPDVTEYWYIQMIYEKLFYYLGHKTIHKQNTITSTYYLNRCPTQTHLSWLIQPKSSLNLLLDLCYLDGNRGAGSGILFLSGNNLHKHFAMEIGKLHQHSARYQVPLQYAKARNKELKRKKLILLSLG